MKKRIAAIVTALFMIPNVSLAALDVTLDKKADKIIVNGESEEATISLVLLNPGYTIDDTADELLSESVLFYRPVEVTEGTYSYSIPMPKNTERGIFTLYAGSERKAVYYASATERLSMIGEIREAEEEGTLPAYLADNGAYLCDAEKFLMVSDLTKVSAIATEILSEKTLTENSPESLGDIATALDFAVVVQLLNESKIEELSEISKVVVEENMAVKFSQKSLIPSNKQDDIAERISGKNIADEGGFYKALQESIFIGVINESKTLSSAQRREFFDEFATDVSLDISNYSTLPTTKRNSVIAKLSAAKANTISVMQKELDAIYKEEKASSIGSGGSGGSGGGGGSSSHISASGIGGGVTAAPVTTEKEQKVSFSDMNNYSWAEDAVNTLSGKKIVNGYKDGTFKPEGNITRGEFVAMIARAFLPDYKGNSRSFDDVNVNDWHYNFVMSALENQIVSGTGEGKFLPNEKIRRSDIAVILNNLLKFKNIALESADSSFDDAEMIPAYALEAVNILNKNGIINGDENNNMRPADFANRAEAAVMIHRFMILTGEGSK